MLQVLPTHFSLLNCTVKSLSMLMASTGQSATQEPQLKHFSVSTSINLGTITEMPLSLKAFTIFSCCSSGISTSISPPLEFMNADKITIGTLYSIIIWEAIGCGTCSSVNLKRSLTTLYRPKSLDTSSDVIIPITFLSISTTGSAEMLC